MIILFVFITGFLLYCYCVIINFFSHTIINITKHLVIADNISTSRTWGLHLFLHILLPHCSIEPWPLLSPLQGMVLPAVPWGAQPHVLSLWVRRQKQLLSADQPGLFHQPRPPHVLPLHRPLHRHGERHFFLEAAALLSSSGICVFVFCLSRFFNSSKSTAFVFFGEGKIICSKDKWLQISPQPLTMI